VVEAFGMDQGKSELNSRAPILNLDKLLKITLSVKWEWHIRCGLSQWKQRIWHRA
jgi:hypothetical protein